MSSIGSACLVSDSDLYMHIGRPIIWTPPVKKLIECTLVKHLWKSFKCVILLLCLLFCCVFSYSLGYTNKTIGCGQLPLLCPRFAFSSGCDHMGGCSRLTQNYLYCSLTFKLLSLLTHICIIIYGKCISGSARHPLPLTLSLLCHYHLLFSVPLGFIHPLSVFKAEIRIANLGLDIQPPPPSSVFSKWNITELTRHRQLLNQPASL